MFRFSRPSLVFRFSRPQAHADGLLVFRRFDIYSDVYLDTEEAQKALRYLGDVECAQTKTHTDSIIACVMPWSRS